MPDKPGRRALGTEELAEWQVAAVRDDGTETTGGAERSRKGRPSETTAFLEVGTELQRGRFVIRKPLGIGGMGVVYEAEDRLLACPVALKTLLGADTKRLLDLKREFRSLEGLSHPNLVKLGELFEDGDLLFFTMERVHGDAFTRYVRPAGVDVERLSGSLVQLTQGLMALHEAGKVHRDVKPSNTLVEATGRVVLLDFGLLIDAPFAEADTFAGTAEYMAPEQLRGHVSAAADWYALGVMLYESITGKLPFADAAPSIKKSLKQEPVPPIVREPDVSPEIARLCLDLLEAEPARRPRGAEVLERLMEARGRGTTSTTSHVSRAPPFSSFPASARFSRAPRLRKLVGRRAELEEMEAVFSAACERGPTALFVVGEPGVGKSALLSVARAGLQGRARVFHSRCHENEFLAHKALDGIVDGLFEELDKGPLSVIEGLPTEDRSALVQVFPVLRPLFQYGVPDESGSDLLRTVHSTRRAAFRGLRTLLSRLAIHTPLVLVIDDLQWADLDSLLALEALMTKEPASSILLVMAARNGTEAPRFEIPLRRLELGALDAESATELARSLLEERKSSGVSPADLAAEAGRLPLFVEMLA